MSSGVLVIAEARLGELRDVSLELVSAALSVKADAGSRVAVAVLDHEPGRFADRLAVDGVDELLLVPTPTEHFEAHVAGRALNELIAAESPYLVLLGFTIDSLGFAPAVAARGGLGFASDVTALRWESDPPTLVAARGAFGDKLVSELEFSGKETTVLMLRGGTFEPAEASGASPAIRTVELALDGVAKTEHLGFQEAESADVDITKAPFLMSIGRGVEDQDNIPRFEALAELLGATLSSSRPLVDAGWMPSARQVGQSGKTVKPRVYLALGISGAVQHLAGMRTAETIIAVNTDPEAPIFGVAHYGAVVDMFEFADELEQQFG
jgi:electron transfer flavoprotein alpha subunit